MIQNNEVGGNVPALEATRCEITPAMDEAGAWALRVAGVGLLEAEEWEVLAIAREVYRAMWLASEVEPKSLESGSLDRETPRPLP